MHPWSNLKSYCVYLFTVLWMLTKGFLGYQQDKDKREARIGHSEPKSQHGSLEKSKDLEANLLTSIGGSLEDILDSSEKQLEGKPDPDDFIIYQTSPAARDPSPEPAQSSLAKLEPLKEKGITDAPSTLTGVQESIKHNNPRTDGLLINVLNDAVPDHKALQDATANRLIFVKGLKYTENWNFKFPVLLSVLRATSIKPKHPLTPRFIPSASPTPTISTLCLPSKPTTTPSTPTPTPTPPSLTSFPTSTSSASSYSSIYTITSTASSDLPTTPAEEEDIPISLMSLPSWRRDPERAKFVFGSFARDCSESSFSCGSGDMIDDIAVNEKCVVAGDCSNAEEASKTLGFESMVIGIGLTPPPGLPVVKSPKSSSDSRADLAATKSGHRSFLREDDGISLSNVKSRESIMSDVLSWVESSSSTIGVAV